MKSATDGSPAPAARALACAQCGTTFSCDLSGACWCMDETFRLPMPTKGADCLCPECLRAIATKAR